MIGYTRVGILQHPHLRSGIFTRLVKKISNIKKILVGFLDIKEALLNNNLSIVLFYKPKFQALLKFFFTIKFLILFTKGVIHRKKIL